MIEISITPPEDGVKYMEDEPYIGAHGNIYDCYSLKVKEVENGGLFAFLRLYRSRRS